MATVLVTDGEQRATLACVRSLGREGHRVLVTSESGRSLAGASRYATVDLPLPSSLADHDAFLAKLIEYTKRFEVEVLLPITEQALRAVLPNRSRFGSVLIPFAEAEVFEAVSDKHRVLSAAAEVGILTPSGAVLEKPTHQAPARLPFPVAIKSSRSVVDDAGTFRKTGVAYARNEEELGTVLAASEASDFPLLIQHKIEGPGVGVFLLVWGGKTLAAFAHRRLREKPPSGGVSVYRESVPLDPRLLALSEALLAKLDWRGIAMVEYKVEARTGDTYLMEINGRFWGSLQLAIDAGIDFPGLLLRAARGESMPPDSRHYRVGIRSRWLWGDVDHLIASVRAILKQPMSMRVRSLAKLAPIFIPWRPGDRSEVLWLSDPAPFLRESAEWFRTSFGRLRDR